MNNLGTKALKVYLDTADSDSIPLHAVGSEIYSWVIVNLSLSLSLKKYILPVEQTINPGTQYVLYFAPWDFTTNVYADDYRDMEWIGSDAYADGKAVANNNGTWSVSDSGNLDLNFETFGCPSATTTSTSTTSTTSSTSTSSSTTQTWPYFISAGLV